MLGSAIDGEDVAQEAALKALEAFPRQTGIRNLEAWVFRIARNAALDFLRRRNREPIVPVDDGAEFADPYMDTERGLQAAASLRQFMRLPPTQRASVILMDVIGYSLEEVADILETTVPAVKASLHRGRDRLQRLADEPATAPSAELPAIERRQLANYVDRFNARDFDALRRLLADDVRLHVRNERRFGTSGRRILHPLCGHLRCPPRAWDHRGAAGGARLSRRACSRISLPSTGAATRSPRSSTSVTPHTFWILLR